MSTMCAFLIASTTDPKIPKPPRPLLRWRSKTAKSRMRRWPMPPPRVWMELTKMQRNHLNRPVSRHPRNRLRKTFHLLKTKPPLAMSRQRMRSLHLQVPKKAPRVSLLIHPRRPMLMFPRKARSTQESNQTVLSALMRSVARLETSTLVPSLTQRAALTETKLDSLHDLTFWMIDERGSRTIPGVAASTITIMAGHSTSPWATAETLAVSTGNTRIGRRWTNRSVVPPIEKGASHSQTGPIAPGVSVLMHEMVSPGHGLAHHHTPIVQG